MSPKMHPSSTARNVNSGRFSSGATNGLNSAKASLQMIESGVPQKPLKGEFSSGRRGASQGTESLFWSLEGWALPCSHKSNGSPAFSAKDSCRQSCFRCLRIQFIPRGLRVRPDADISNRRTKEIRMHFKLGKFAFPIAASLSLAACFCQGQSLLTHHVRQATQDGSARSMGRLPSTQTLNLVITLPLRNQDQLDQLLKDLYDPSSPSYRQFLTVDQFTEQFGPTQQDYEAVINFAKQNGLTVTAISPNRVNVQVSGSVAKVESAFHVNMSVYQHPTENRSFYPPDREPSTDLTFSLWHVSGLDNFSLPHPAGLDRIPAGSASKSNATTGSGPSASFLSSDMRAAYYGGSLTGSGQSLGLLEYYGTDLADLTTYFSNAKQTNSVPVNLVSTDGTSTSCIDTKAGGDCDDTQQTLDMTQALGIAPGLSSLVVYVGSTDSAIFNAMATAKPLNAQLSSSWTWNPADPTTDDPYFKEFAAQGQNLFQAAGDNKKW